MALLERTARVTVSAGLGGTREFTATATVRDTPAGQAVFVDYTIATTGLGPPVQPDSLTLSLRVDNGSTVVRTVPLGVGGVGGQVTVYMTADGTSTGSPRAGTLRLRLDAVKNTGATGQQYAVSSDTGTTDTLPSGYSVTARDQGWIRGTTTITGWAASDVGHGQAGPPVYAYGDPIYLRATLGAGPFQARTLTAFLGAGSATPIGLSVPAGGTVAEGATSTSPIDNRWPASVSSPSWSMATPPNSALTGLPWTVLTSVAAGTIPVDPRLVRTPLFQLDDDSYATPPLSKDKPHRRLNTQQGFLSSRTTNARGRGLNGITYDVELRADKPGGLISQTGLTTTTRGGQDGWAPSFLPWSSALPGGRWIKSATITGPSTAAGAAYLLQADGTTRDYFLTAADPDLSVAVNAAHDAGLGGRHFTAGMALTVTGYLVNRRNGLRVADAAITMARCALVRGAGSAASNGGPGVTYEFLGLDGTWKQWPLETPQDFYAMDPSPADPAAWERRITSDASWGTRDVRVIVVLEYEGVLYTGDLTSANVGPHHLHDTDPAGAMAARAPIFDPTGLFR